MASRHDQSRRRRLLVVNPTSLLGGAELVLQRLLDAIPDDEWQVIAAIPEGRLADRLQERGLTVIQIPDLKLPSGPRFLAAPRAIGRALRAAGRVRRAGIGPDAVVANGLFSLPALRIARLRCPVVFLVHDVLDRFALRTVLRLCARIVDVAVVPSEAAARSLRLQGLPTRVVPNGTPWPVPPASPEPPVPPVVGELAALTPLKAQDVLLDAVARLKRRDVIVEFAGEALPKDGPYVQDLRARAQDSGLEGRIRFLGRVEDPLARLRRWSIAVLPSIGPESFGLAVLEAMSVGVPVIATSHGGPPEIVGDAGLLIPPRDPEALAVAIGRLLDDADLRHRCRAAGPRLVANAYTLGRQQEVLLSVLRDVTSGGAARSASSTVRRLDVG